MPRRPKPIECDPAAIVCPACAAPQRRMIVAAGHVLGQCEAKLEGRPGQRCGQWYHVQLGVGAGRARVAPLASLAEASQLFATIRSAYERAEREIHQALAGAA